jgi:hypothetical protein
LTTLATLRTAKRLFSGDGGTVRAKRLSQPSYLPKPQDLSRSTTAGRSPLLGSDRGRRKSRKEILLIRAVFGHADLGEDLRLNYQIAFLRGTGETVARSRGLLSVQRRRPCLRTFGFLF